MRQERIGEEDDFLFGFTGVHGVDREQFRREFAGSRLALLADRDPRILLRRPVVVQPGCDLHHLPAVRAGNAVVGGQESLQKRGSAAHHADDHDRRLDRLGCNLGISADPLLSTEAHPQAVHEARAQNVHADVIEVGGGVAFRQHVQWFLEAQRAPTVEVFLLLRGVHESNRVERVRHCQNFRWWLVSPTWSTYMTRVSNHQVPSMRWKVSR